ncbi:protein amalgam [Anastrepha ludens]|uniref:protein amalgam n=1 Tax=Anastrepha ludens TaxID=28586 RepID=UPI0023B003C0|nr:protein amalgam [Anastrepha ludens]
MDRFLSQLVALAVMLILLPSVLHANQPVITHISKDVVASVGEDVQFNCTVENVGRMSVSWAKRSVVLSMRNILSLSDPRYTITETRDDKVGNATYSLKITKIEASDMGPYECQVIVSATGKITKTLNLSIKHPPIISEERTPKSKLVTEGQNLEVSCFAAGFPQPTIWWKREDNAIMPAGGQTLAGPTLRIREVHRLDRGTYYCVADNGVGQPDERKVLIEVEFRPQIAVLRPKVAQVLGHNAELECSVQGYPAPAVFWFRNGTKLYSESQIQVSTTASSYETTTSVLRITNVSEMDYGDYYCNASNKLGYADARLHLFQPVIPVPSAL